MAEDSAELKSVKAMLRSVLMSCKEGVPAAILQKDYKEVVGDFLPYKKLGYPNLEQFIMSIPDVVRVSRQGGEYIFHAVADESTAHIQAMVKKQRSKKVKKPIRRPRGGGGGPWFMNRPPHPHKTLLRTPNFNGPKAPRHGMPSFMTSHHNGPRAPRHGMPSSMTSHHSGPRAQRDGMPTSHHKGLTPVEIQVGNSSSGERTVRVKPSHLLSKAMREANTDRNTFPDQQKSSLSRFELPPRFRKQIDGHGQGHHPISTTPKRPAAKTDFAKISGDDGDKYLRQLQQYLKKINQPEHFDTSAAAGGYVSSVTIENITYGSEDIYRTSKEAEQAVAMVVMSRLDQQQTIQEPSLPEIDWNDTTNYSAVQSWAEEVSSPDSKTVSTLSSDKLRIVKARVKEILQNKRNGLWGTRIPHEYKERYKEDPPSDLLQRLKTWTEIALVEFVPNTDRDIVYPVFDDVSMKENKTIEGQASRKDHSQETVNPAKIGPITEEGPTNVGPTKVVPSTVHTKVDSTSKKEKDGVKDLYALYVETKGKQANILKNLAIPRQTLVTSGDEVVMYLTYIYNPGYFCVQREDCNIDTISEQLQTHCKLASSPDPKALQKGQYCAGLYSGDGCWTRAQIIKLIGEDRVELLFVDYGNVETVKIESVRWLSADIANHPVQAINCSLYGVEPLEGETEWSSEAGKVFASQVEEEALIGVPKCFYDDLVDIELYLKSDPTVSISEKLIKTGVVRGVASKAQSATADDKKVHPDDIILPEEKEWDVHVTYISSSTNSVMLRLVGEEYSDRLETFQTQMEMAFKNSSSEAPVLEGAIYVAYDDGLYHRVRVISQTDKKVSCYFLDHGDTDDLSHEQLQPLDPAVNTKLPYQAVEVSLYGLEEVATNITALERMCDLALGKTCVAQIVERDDIPSIVLFDTSCDTDININENILKTIEAEGGGIGTPRSASPAPGLNLSNSGTTVSGNRPAVGVSPSSQSESDNSRTVATEDVAKQKLFSPYMPPPPPTETPPNSPTSSSMITCQREPEVTEICDKLNLDLNITEKDSKTKINTDSNDVIGTPDASGGETGTGVLSLKSDVTSLPPFRLPDEGDCLDVHVNLIHDPSNFVCLPYSEMNKLNQLLHDMMDYYSVIPQPISKDDVKLGQMYAGHKDTIWYRVKVTQFVGTDLVSVYLVDMGEYSVMMVSELQPLQPRFCQLPMMAINARLGRIKPESGSWYEAAKYKFIELAREKDLIGLVQDYDKETGVVDLNLIDTSNDNFDVCIDEVLVKMGFAMFYH